MAEQPALVIVDDDQSVIFSVAQDLQARYGDRYRIIPTDSGASALDVLNRLKLRGAPVALIIADQRMPGMTGIELLREGRELYADAKRILLTAYADTDVAIRAINDVQIDHYLLKPWSPPEERLFPVVDDVLDDWQAGYHPPFEGVRILGHRWSAATFQIKDFLARNLVPYHSIDVERDEEGAQLIERNALDPERLPIVILEDGSTLVQPTQAELSARIGLETRPALEFYDLIIVGAGPSGLAGAVYGASEGLRTLLIERQAPGGQAGTSSRIENYLGFPAGLTGADLARRGLAQARRLGAELLSGEVTALRVDGPYRIVTLADGTEISCHALLLAAGVSYRRLDVPGIERLTGAGVYYGGALSEAIATCGEKVFIVGGANSAGQAAIHFARYAACVTMLIRGNDLAKSGMSRYLIDRIGTTENIVVRFNTEVAAAGGETHLESLRLVHTRTAAEETVPADALFIFIGAKPYTDWLRALVALDGGGYVLTGPDLAKPANDAPAWPLPREPWLLETNVPGIFAAGDIRHQSIKRIASATGEGAMAIQFVHRYLSSL